VVSIQYEENLKRVELFSVFGTVPASAGIVRREFQELREKTCKSFFRKT
jgi:hypothetical protein